MVAVDEALARAVLLVHDEVAGAQLERVDLPAAEQFGQRGIDAGENLARVMLDPTRLREDLREFALRAADDVAGAVEQVDGAVPADAG